MKTIKVSEATNIQLDWLVAKAQGRKEIKIFAPHRPTDRGWIEVRFNPEPKAATARFDPTVSWEFGGPIIEREEIGFAKYGPNGSWKAVIGETPRGSPFYGPTPLIAAMRCYVASKLGDEVEIPEELS